MENEEYKQLGIMNSWKTLPAEYQNCVRLGHMNDGSVAETRDRSNWHYCECKVCKIKWEFDSSG